MKRKQLSRAEVNKLARNILQQHSVNLGDLQLTCSPRNIMIAGSLNKGTGKAFMVRELETILRELKSIKGVQNVTFSLDNWEITDSGITAKEEKKEKKKMKKKVIKKDDAPGEP